MYAPKDQSPPWNFVPRGSALPSSERNVPPPGHPEYQRLSHSIPYDAFAPRPPPAHAEDRAKIRCTGTNICNMCGQDISPGLLIQVNNMSFHTSCAVETFKHHPDYAQIKATAERIERAIVQKDSTASDRKDFARRIGKLSGLTPTLIRLDRRVQRRSTLFD